MKYRGQVSRALFLVMSKRYNSCLTFNRINGLVILAVSDPDARAVEVVCATFTPDNYYVIYMIFFCLSEIIYL